mgnify:CR=1 FL=1
MGIANDTIDILMITYNRAGYTKRALGALLDSCDGNMRVWVWHNGTHEPTLEIVRSYQNHPHFHHLELCPENKKLREPTNWFWKKSDGAYVSKVDDDCILPKGWSQTLRRAHQDNPNFGAIGTWRFLEEDFVPNLAGKKTETFNGGHQLMKNPWVQGSGYLLRRECQQQVGYIKESESFPGYLIRAGCAGWQNGWYFPFIREEHMDDPRSKHCEIKTDEKFMENRPLSAINDNVTTLAQWAERVKYMAFLVQEANPDPKYHSGWRKKIKGVKSRTQRALGIKPKWRSAK